MRDLCFCSYAYGWYQDFVPLYIFSILTAYPEYFVRIYLHDNLTENNKRALSLIPSDSFEVIENYRGIDLTHVKSLPAVRFLLPRSEFTGFRYVYMGDVDFIVYNEVGQDFITYHTNHCDKTGLPFSNTVNLDDGRWRLTGLHFFKVDEYYDKMEPQIEEVLRGCDYGKSIQEMYCFDEQILFYMANNVFDLTKLDGHKRPHHGLHFGYVRDRPTGHSFARKTRLELWQRDLPQVERVLKSPIFDKLYEEMGQKVRAVVDAAKMILYAPIFL